MMEQRLIDANALRAKCDAPHWCVWMSEIDDAPTVDAVPVVRCGECKHRSSDYYIRGDYLCEKRGCRFFCKDNDFCSYGERRDSDG